jgi:hypothetical protein
MLQEEKTRRMEKKKTTCHTKTKRKTKSKLKTKTKRKSATKNKTDTKRGEQAPVSPTVVYLGLYGGLYIYNVTSPFRRGARGCSPSHSTPHLPKILEIDRGCFCLLKTNGKHFKLTVNVKRAWVASAPT